MTYKKLTHRARAWLTIALTTLGSLAAFPAHPAPAKASWQGTVSYVVDGDTVMVRPAGGGKPVSIRIEGIDAPEICQAGGPASRDALKGRVQGKRLTVRGKGRDQHGRLIAQIRLGAEDQGKWMVTQGQAWSYRYGRNPGLYAAQQRSAKAAGRGIFSRLQARAPMEPRVFRKQHGPCYGAR